MTPLNKAISRLTNINHRGRQLAFRVTALGIYTKGRGERWSNAYFVPWEAVDDLGARLKALSDRRRKKLEKELTQ